MERKRLQFMLEVAILAAISLVLDQIGFRAPQGGSATLSMLPIFVMAFRWGFAGGVATGLLSGILQLFINPYVIHPVQGLLDYPIAYGVVGLAAATVGWLMKAKAEGKKGSMIGAIVVGCIIGGILRFMAHFIGGIVFFAHFAGDQPVALYSFLYNAGYMIPSIILSAIVASLLFTSAPRLLQKA